MAASSTTATVQDQDGVRVVTLNRPASLNAFDGELFHAVAQALGDAAARADVACVVLTGAGRAFSAGSDLTDQQDSGGYDAFMEQLERFPKPLIAAVNGLAVGIGTTLLGHCDIVLAAESARFRLPFTSLGLVPEAGSTAMLPAMLGGQSTAYALFTSKWLSVDEAGEHGLVWRAVPDADLLGTALELAEQIAAMPVEALMATKKLLLAERGPAAQRARAREDAEFRRLAAGPAHAEALAAFREKREPNFGALRPETEMDGRATA